MTTTRAYTTIEQNKKLAEILPLETSDMIYTITNGYHTPFVRIEKVNELTEDDICAWSLAALLEQMPSEIKGHNLTINKSYWQVEKTYVWELSYEEYFDDYPPSILVSTSSIELINACYEMIIKLHERNLL